MKEKEFMYWLKGYVEGKLTNTPDNPDIEDITDVINQRIDDIDSNDVELVNMYKDLGFRTCTLFKRVESDGFPDFFVFPLPKSSYIIFPWERKDSQLKADYLKIKEEL